MSDKIQNPAAARGRLTVLAGPTAVGKGTVSADVRKRYPDVWLSTSVTTRNQRPGEIDGVHYHFISEAEFADLEQSGELLEWAVVHGQNKYGTPRQPVLDVLAQGRPAPLEIDLPGAPGAGRRIKNLPCRAPPRGANPCPLRDWCSWRRPVGKNSPAAGRAAERNLRKTRTPASPPRE